MNLNIGKNLPMLLLFPFLLSCSQKNVSAENAFFTREKTMSAAESEAFLANYINDSAKRSEEEIKKSKNEALRKLGDYKTKYNVACSDVSAAMQALETVMEEDGEKESSSEGESEEKEFSVIGWGPQDEVPAEMNSPVFYVAFSAPVHELSALEKTVDGESVFKISPPVKGKYRWIGSRQLNFIPEEKLEPNRKYTIQVNENLCDAAGEKISGERTFFTTVQKILLMSISPGAAMARNYWYEEDSGVPLKYASDAIIKLNTRITAQELSELLTVSEKGQTLAYTSTPVELYYDKEEHCQKYKETDSSRIHFVHISGAVEKGDRVNFDIALPGGGTSSRSYFVQKPFCFRDARFSNYSRTLSLYFNQPVDESSVLENISFSPEVDKSSAQVVVSGKNVYLKNLPFAYNTSYTITLSEKISDVYNQTLSGNNQADFTVEDLEPYMNMLATGNKILEAQFPHTFIIEHRNLLSGEYAVYPTDDPINYNYRSNSSPKVPFKTAVNNEALFECIDLDPYLKHGLGFLTIEGHGIPNPKNYQFSERVNIQVTDLGVTARAGYDKVVALVRHLSDNSPVENAEVWLYGNEYNDREEGRMDEILSDAYGKGRTDKNGYVEFDISLDKEKRARFLKDTNILSLYVKKGDDKVTYRLDTHSKWRFGIPSRGLSYVENDVRNMVFMFTDRGLYRPGETVSFRGIARKLHRSELTPMNGSFECRLEKNSWRDEAVYGVQKGTLSESGGFSGSFEIPEDAEPGSYRIAFQSGDSSVCYEYLTVAYFEKAKFQTSAQIVDIDYFTGDSISAELSASYLAGGSLTDARYRASWYKQASSFVPPSPDAKNYVFGPENSYYSARFISESKGKVNENGVTRISCNTEQDVIGQPYVYRAEIEVSDISNQTIFTGAQKIVHPGAFYIGAIARFPEAFPKAREKVSIPFALFKTDGSYASPADVSGKIEYKITCSYWSYINELSVDGVYSRWERISEDVASGSVDVAAKGSVSFVPEKAGYYTVSFSANDKKQRPVKTDKSFYVTGNDYFWFDSENAAALRLTPDKSEYKPGETAKLLLESPLQSGDYLITVERDSIYTSEVRHIDSPCTQIEIPVKDEYLPVAYVSIASYSVRNGEPSHQYGKPDLGKPKGYYGVTELRVALDSVSFDVSVESEKKVYRPKDKITLNLKATKNGSPVKNAELSVMVVDRAVVDLINYHVKDPISFFYNPRNYPLAVTGGDSRDFLMDPVTYKIKSLQGGDAAARNESADAEEKENERKDFRPTALFEPVVFTDDNGNATVSFTLPDSLTTYRVTVFGVTKNDFSLDESEVLVQNPVNVQPVQPRRLRIRDTAEAGVLITNLDEKPQKISVGVSVRAPLQNYADDSRKGLITKSGDAFIDGKKSQTVVIPAGKTLPVHFNVAAVSTGNVELVYDIKSAVLNEKLVSKILIEKSYVYETVATTGVVESSSNKKKEASSETEKLVIPGWCDDGMGELEITLDPSQLGLLSSSVKYVFDYPYGCLEQQSSRILPLVIFGDYIDVFGLKSSVDNPRKVVTNWFASVKNEQHYDGSFPYWEGSSYASAFVSLRFAHIYQLARNNGYSKEEIGYDIEKLKNYLLSVCDDWKSARRNDPYAAYFCYVFSLLGDSRCDALLDSLFEYCQNPENEKSLSTMAYVALAYECRKGSAAKRNAEKIAKMIRTRMIPNARSISLDGFSSDGYYCGMYDSETEGLATALQLFVKQNSSDTLVDKILYTLLQKQKHGYWQSTATTARVFEAISELINARNLTSLDFVSSAVIKDNSGLQKVLLQQKFEGLSAKPAVKAFSFRGSELKNVPKNKKLDLEFSKDGTGSLYYTAQMRYAVPDELCSARDEGFEVVYSVFDEDGTVVTTTSPISKAIVLQSGKTYRIEATVLSPQSREYVALRIPVPSGAEIVDAALSTGASKNTSGAESSGGYQRYQYECFYDNEAQCFYNSMSGGTYRHSVTIRAARRGVYPTPPVQAECMYEPEVFGRAEGLLFIIQ